MNMEMAPAVSSLTYARMAISLNGSGVMATKSTLTKNNNYYAKKIWNTVIIKMP